MYQSRLPGHGQPWRPHGQLHPDTVRPDLVSLRIDMKRGVETNL